MLYFSTVMTALGVGAVMLLVFALWRAYSKNATVAAALDTVKLVESRLEILKARVADLVHENEQLRITVKVLSEQVTKAAAVRQLITVVERIEEKVDALR